MSHTIYTGASNEGNVKKETIGNRCVAYSVVKTREDCP